MSNTAFTIGLWNILYDTTDIYKAAAQSARLDNIAKTLQQMPVKPDLFGLIEVEHSDTRGHHGQWLADTVAGDQGYWLPNNRDGEHIGVFGSMAAQLEPIDIGDGRTAGLLRCGDVTICLVHLTFSLRGETIRSKQLARVAEAIGDGGPAIIFGDFNSAPMQRSRRLLRTHGFRSVFHGSPDSNTVISEAYRKRLALPYRLITKVGIRADDIYVRGLNVIDSGIFVGDSDHHGVWATVEHT